MGDGQFKTYPTVKVKEAISFGNSRLLSLSPPPNPKKLIIFSSFFLDPQSSLSYTWNEKVIRRSVFGVRKNKNH
jgi:hypothetical protein